MKRFALLLTLFLLVPSAAGAASSGAGLKTRLAQLETVTRQLRGLPAPHPVKAVFPSNTAFNQDYTQYVRRGTPDPEIELDRRESVLVGFLTAHDNLRQILFHQFAGNVEGFYDYQSKALYVRNDPTGVFGVNRYNIAHEYTHALQDENYGLARLLPDQFPLSYRNSDMVAAHHALIEGDAVNTEILYIRKTYSRKALAALLKLQSQPVPGPVLPPAMKREFYFPYTTGVDFVTRLYAGKGIAGIDAAFRRLPSSTYEIMHPIAYLHGWKPAAVILHGVQGFSDWQQTDDDVFGAFGYDLLIWQFRGKRLADRVTSAYRGDRYIFLQKGKANAMLFKSVWNNPQAAQAARNALISSLHTRFRHASIAVHPSVALITDRHMAVYFRLQGSGLTMAFAPTAALATQLGTAPAN